MKKGDLLLATIWLVLGIAVAVISYTLKLGSLRNPGPGLQPFLLGLILSICSLPFLVRSFLAIRVKETEVEEGIWSGIEFKKLILTVALLLSYIMLLSTVRLIF